MEPIISVIIPVYNEEKRLNRCIKSILNQDIQELELILVDDGSTDSSGKICKEYTKKEKRVKVIRQKNSGVGNARNTGIAASKGKYITFVDSDDYLPNDPSIYRKAIFVLEHNQVEVVAWLWQFQNENGNLVIDPRKIPSFFEGKQSTRKFAKGLYYGSYANGLVVSVWNKLFQREYIENIRFEGRIYEDDEWMSQVLARPANIFCEREFWYIYTQNNSSLTHQDFQEKNLKMLDILKNRVRLFESENFIRYSIFFISPKWYEVLVLKMREKHES